MKDTLTRPSSDAASQCWRQLCVLPLLASLCLFSGCATSLLNATGANSLGTKLAELVKRDKDDLSDDDEDENDFDTTTRVETPLLRDYISVTGNSLVALRGVGLVVGLDGTGGDPPPSHLRKELMDEMAKLKIPNPSRILASRDTALVIVTAYLPPMVREGQTFDVRVALPPNSEATSLKGGRLLETRLTEEQSVAGRGTLKGHQYAVASGAILSAFGDGGKGNRAMLRRGSIPGGAASQTERNLEVLLRNEYRSTRTSTKVASAISNRLHHYDRYGRRTAMADPKTDTLIELKVHPTYRNNFPRYQQVIRSIAMRESDIARRVRLERLAEDILIPEKAASSALQMEAIGSDSISFLKKALQSSSLEVRFHAAQALAYMEDSSGVKVLQEAAASEPAFRVYALAALSVISDADSVVALRELMNDNSLETRYGAVRALKENNPHDTMLGTTEFPKQFILHAVNSSGPPAVHVVRYRAPEVVVFGSQQELRLPATLNVGNRITVIGRAGDDKVTITKYSLNAEPERHQASNNLVEILHAVAALGARYPDVVQMLLEADEQVNLTGEFGIDRLPQAGRSFIRNSDDGDDRAKLGTPSLTPGLFDRVEEDQQEDTVEEDSSALERMFAMRDANEGDSTDASENDSASESPQDAGLELTEPELANDVVESIATEDLEMSAEDVEPAASDDVVIEQIEFKEPVGSRLKRIFFSPFQKEEPQN